MAQTIHPSQVTTSNITPNYGPFGDNTTTGGTWIPGTSNVTASFPDLEKLAQLVERLETSLEDSDNDISIRLVFQTIRDLYLESDDPQDTLDEIDRLAAVGLAIVDKVSETIDKVDK